MIGALGFLVTTAFLAAPILFDSSDSEDATAENAAGVPEPVISLGKAVDNLRAEDSAPDVGSLVWRDPSERTIRRQKEARRRSAAEAKKQQPSARRAVHPEQATLKIRGRAVVPAGVEDGPMLTAPETPTADVSSSRETAQRLVREARVALTEGRVDEAKQKALAADRMNVAFALFEDRPSAILAEIRKLESAQAQSTSGTASVAQPTAEASVLTDPIPIDPPAVPDPEIAKLEQAPADGPSAAANVPAETAPALPEATPELAAPSVPDLAPTLPEPELVQTVPATPPVNELSVNEAAAPSAPVSEPTALPQYSDSAEVRYGSVPQSPGSAAPSIRIMPADSRNPIPDDGMRLSFDFHAAPWEFVLTQFAAKAKLPLEMTLVPAGSLTYVDRQPYSAQETLNILNVLLIEKGFTLIHREGQLILKPQPSAISSRTDGTATEEEQARMDAATKERATLLLAEARHELATGNLDEARLKARRAAGLNAVFGLLEDRPETVLEEIRRVASVPLPALPRGTSAPFPGGGDPWMSEKRMSINFKDASWDLVMREFGKSAGLEVLMDETPPGTFSHVDTGLYSPAETLEILNGFLSRVGYGGVREGNKLRVMRLNPMLRGLR
jgi:hypothetical protein